MNLIREFYPGNVPLERVDLYAEKHLRSQISVKSKIQKIRLGHQSKLESELDRLFIKKQKDPAPMTTLKASAPQSCWNLAVQVPKKPNTAEIGEMKDYLIDFLKKSAVNGIEQSELRGKVPKSTVDSETLAKLLRELETETRISITRLSGLHLDPNRLQFFEREAIDHIRNVLRRKYKSGLVEGVYPLDALFEDADKLREQVTITQFLNIRSYNFIFWRD